MSYQVALLNFEGPLDLLLQLIERSELEVTKISLATVTTQFIDYTRRIENIDALELNWFVDVASRLIYIKSTALLPDVKSSEPESDEAELTEQLQRYQIYKQAAAQLEEQLRHGGRAWHRTVTPPPPTRAQPQGLPTNLDLPKLRELFEQAIARLPNTEQSVIEKHVSLEDLITRVRQRINSSQPVKVTALIEECSTRLEIVVLFLALLELIKSGELQVNQDKQFGDMIITNGAD